MIRLFYSIILITLSYYSFSQCNGRYENEIFNSINVSTLNYSDVYIDNEHTMDIYTPVGDTVSNRPLIIYMHGGSFYGGDKGMTDCVDFCTSFSKRGYVTASINYRLANMLSFLLSQEEQYKAVLRAVADAKSAVRFFRKDFANGNSYGINPNAIYVAGYSAGGVIAIHQAFIDSLTDLPLNIQSYASVIGGTLEGDAGNIGYSSKIHGVINIAGGINDVNWIDSYDEPIVSAQGDNDNTVNFNCGPGLNNPAILTLCGVGEIHPKADNVGVLNDMLVFNNTDHSWAALGNANTKFMQAVDFFSDFIFNILPCNQVTSYMQNANKDFSFYPNPTQDKLYFHTENPISIVIYNILGEVVISQENIHSGAFISLKDLNKGAYFLKTQKSTNYKKIIVN